MIDFHAHAFPDETTGRFWQEAAGFVPTRTGTIDELGGLMAEAGIRRAVVLLFPRSRQRHEELRASAGRDRTDADLRARVRDEISALNAWGCAVAREDERFHAFVGVNPLFQSADDIRREIERGVSNCGSGVKIIPPAMRLYADDPLLAPVYEACAELEVPLLSQSGAGGGPIPPGRGHHGRPSAFALPLRRHPGLVLVLAHLARGYEQELIELAERHPGVHADLSLRLGGLGGDDPADLRRLVRRIGPERILFGTNYPIADPRACVEDLGRLGLTDAERELVGGGNAKRLLGG